MIFLPEYSYTLSEKDEYVPEGYIGIYELFSDRKYSLPDVEPEKWCIGEKKLHQMRMEAFHAVKKRLEMCKASDYARFWNGNLDAINAIGINPFGNLLCFKELSTAMICFQQTVENKSNKNKRKIISFGIKDSIYREYYKERKRALLYGVEPEPVNLFDSHKKRTGNVFKLPQAVFAFDTEESGKQMMRVKKNALYNMFEFWCKAKGIQKIDGLYQAMQLLMQTFPVKGMKDIGAYERKCDLDYVEVLVPEQTVEESVSTTVWIPKTVHMKMRQIIENHNLDKANIGKPPMNNEKFIIQAVDMLNRKSPLKYSDPKAYKEYLKAKATQERNKRMMGENK